MKKLILYSLNIIALIILLPATYVFMTSITCHATDCGYGLALFSFPLVLFALLGALLIVAYDIYLLMRSRLAPVGKSVKQSGLNRSIPPAVIRGFWLVLGGAILVFIVGKLAFVW
ncbi:MAG TPA: hypothetical protein VI322_00295 [Candidatus Saccharimonadia bacterium]